MNLSFDSNLLQQVIATSEISLMPEIEFLRHGLYKSSTNIIYIIGEIKNVCKNNLIIELVSYVYEKGFNIGFGWGCPIIPILLPGQSSPFRILLKTKKENIDHYTLKAKFGTTNQQPYRELKFLDYRQYVNKESFFCVKGKIQNIGFKEIDSLKIIGTFYDKGGSLIGIKIAYTIPQTLKSNAIASFKLFLENKEISAFINKFNLDFWTSTGLHLVSLKW